MKPPRGIFGYPSPSPGGDGGSITAVGTLLLMLLWCTSLTIATTTAAMKPTRTIKHKRTIDSDPVLIEEDQCASFQTDLGHELKRMLNLSWMESGGEIDMCLCTSTLSNFVGNTKNKQIEIANAFVGSDKVIETLQTLISRSSPQICDALPPNASRTCNPGGRRSDICDFSCKNPYRKSGHGHNRKCVLPASPSARAKKRSLDEEVILMHTSSCQPHEQVCARNGHGSPYSPSSSYRSFSSTGNGIGVRLECTDVSRDLFNCGGCAAGSLGLEYEVLGVDCSELPGVSDVRCVVGRCRVTRCGWGWKINSREDGCVRNRN